MKLFSLLLLYVFLQNVSSEERLMCEMSKLKDLLNSSKTENTKYDSEECKESEQVKSLLEAMGVVGKVIGNVASLNYSCFTVTLSARFGRDLKYRGCMPQGMCNIVEKVFKLIRSKGGIKGTIGKFLFTNSKCAECYGDSCNAPVQKRFFDVSNYKLTCEVSPLQPIIYSANLEELSYTPELCIASQNVSSMLTKFENFGKIIPSKGTFQCFTLEAKTTINNQEIEIRGCVPKGDCRIVEEIFKKIPVMNNKNQTVMLLKEAKCKECDGDMCNTPTQPKGERSLASLRHLSTGLILIVFVLFFV